MKKRLALILALLMAVALLPLTAMSETTEPYVITMYNTLGGPKLGNDTIQHQWLLDNLNLDVQGEWPSGTDASIRLATMVASGEMPDVIATGAGDRQIIQQFVDAGMVQPVDSYLANMPDYCSYVTENVLKYWSDPNDGLQYMLPGFVVDPNSENYTNLLGDPHAFGVRSDILEITGYTELPETFDEFYEFLKAAKEMVDYSDPNYANFIPFAMNWDRFDIWCKNFGCDPTGWELDEENQMLKPIFMQEGWRKAVVYFAKLYREGLMEPEELTLSFDQIVEKAKQGAYGVFCSHITQFNDYIEGALKAMDFPGYYVAGRFPREVKGETTNWYYLNSLGGSIAVFSKDIADMDKVMEYVNWQNTRVGNCITWWGGPDKENSWFYLTDDGQDIVYNAEFMDAMSNGLKTTDAACPWEYWIAGPGVNDSCQLYTNVIGSPGFSAFFGDMRKFGYEDAYFDQAFSAYNFAEKGDEYNAIWTDLQYIMESYRGDIIMRSASDEEANAMVDQMIEEMEAIGVDDMMRECYQVYVQANNY